MLYTVMQEVSVQGALQQGAVCDSVWTTACGIPVQVGQEGRLLQVLSSEPNAFLWLHRLFPGGRRVQKS